MEYLLKASAITTIFYLCYKLFLQRETFFECSRWFLLIGLIATFCIPLLIIPIYVENTNMNLNTLFIVENTTLNTLEITKNSFINLKLLDSIYLLGVALLFIKLVIEFISLNRLLQKQSSKKIAGITYIETNEDISPFSFFSNIVYNPKHFSNQELHHIINHEKAHVMYWHSIDNLIMQIATIICWFNPIIWLYKKCLKQNLEFVADKNAQKNANCQKSYQKLVLKATVKNNTFALANSFYTSLIKKRIIMLNKSKSNKLNAIKYALVLPLLTVFLMSFNTKEIYISKNYTKINKTLGDTERAIINKDFTDNDLEEISKEFKNSDVTLKFNKIKRNSKNEIIAIKIDASYKTKKAKFETSSDAVIKPIKIVYNSENNTISIGSAENFSDHEIYTTALHHGTNKIIKPSSGSNIYVITDEKKDPNNHVEVIIKDADGNIKKEGKIFNSKKKIYSFFNNKPKNLNSKQIIVHKKIKDGKIVNEDIIIEGDTETIWYSDSEENKDINLFKAETDNTLFITNSTSEKPILVLNGREITSQTMKNIEPESILHVNVLKGDSATKKYGIKGKYGVIEITTKN